MTRLFILFFVLINFIGCNRKIEESKKIELMFLDDYIFPASQFFDSTKVGGLSGIDYHDGNYYLVADDSKLPRYYKATIEIEKKLIVQIDFVDMVLSAQQEALYYSTFLENLFHFASMLVSKSRLLL